MTHNESAPELSIVVACVDTAETAQRWLAAITPQLQRHRVELLLAAAGNDDGIRNLQPVCPYVLVVGKKDALTPDLWGAAIARARGRVVAVTISACAPAVDWVDRIIDAHTGSRVGVGGVIEIAPHASAVDRAIHLVRYTPYLPPATAGVVAEIAGDNGTYRREALVPLMVSIRQDGFWETDIHRVLRAGGRDLWLDPGIRVFFAGSHSFAAFSLQRYRHGRVFGRSRALSKTTAARLVRVAAAPLVPLLMLARSLKALAAKRRLDAQALMVIPIAAWFLACWAAGEAVGLARGEAGRNRLG